MAREYVASCTLSHADLTWENSHLIQGDLTDLVRALEDAEGEDISVESRSTHCRRHEVNEPVLTVCGTPVDLTGPNHTAELDGRTYYFCAADCVAGFEKDPAEFLRTHH